jgi:leucyl-tRNA synthetase
VLAPEHPLLQQLTAPDQRAEVEAYQALAAARSEVDRMADTGDKSGVFTGGYALHPLTGEPIPVWTADYVLATYGAGAVMGVPAHDERDFAFARKYGLPVRSVILPPGQAAPAELEAAYTGEGFMTASGAFSGLPSPEGAARIAAELESRGAGRKTVHYRMRDWLISRQRYWGAPIPIVYCPECGEVAVPEDQLPVLLPEMADFQPDGSGRSPLARVSEFAHTSCPSCGGAAERETDTMGGFACSSWYFLRFTNPSYAGSVTGPIDPAAVQYWMPVDLYVGGAEHAVLHLLYARYWTKVMADAGLVSFREPFSRLINQGQLMAPDGKRMSKSRGNVITPDAVVEAVGADALRVYVMFMAPFEQEVTWSAEGIQGARRFLNRLWNLYGQALMEAEPFQGHDAELEKALHRAIQAVTARIETLRFNTMISTLMEFSNTLIDKVQTGRWKTNTFRQCLDTLLVLLAPAAPHMTEELWSLAGHPGSVHRQPWPAWNADLARVETVELPVQVNGRLRGVISAAPDAALVEVEALAKAHARIEPYLEGKTVRQVIYVPGKILNIVVG